MPTMAEIVIVDYHAMITVVVVVVVVPLLLVVTV